MVLTDYEDKVLRNLRECMAMNCADRDLLSRVSGRAGGAIAHEEALEGVEDEDDMFGDPEDAEECDDFDFFSIAAGAGRQLPGSQQPWEYVRPPHVHRAARGMCRASAIFAADPDITPAMMALVFPYGSMHPMMSILW